MTNDPYARWMLMYFRFPAEMQIAFERFYKKYRLFCTYEGKRYRVTGASRLGDVWLATNFERQHGYDLRVNVDKCSEWRESP
jgi:hypothetical protein